MTKEILQRYMSGEASPEEAAAVEADVAPGILAMRNFAEAERQGGGDLERNWARISGRIGEKSLLRTREQRSGVYFGQSVRRWVGYAAVALVVAFGSWSIT